MPKPNPPPYAAQRRVICQTILETLRGYSRAYLGSERVGDHAGDLMIMIALLLGQIEGRPLSASDIAEYIGMPRATVLRHLSAISKHVELIRQKDGRRTTFIMGRASNPELADLIRKINSRVSAACRELAKMDDKPVGE
jgi:DNA-binding transcriptional ArsR family regulator